VLVGALLAFYAWTAATSVGPNAPDRPSTSDSLGTSAVPLDPSNLLAQAFLHGRTDLGLPVPAGLRPFRDGRTASRRVALSGDYHDLSYYHGRLYGYWGPVPALTLFAPAHLITGRWMSQALAVLLYCAVGLCLSVALLRLLVRRLLPRTRTWLLLTAVASLGVGNLAPYLLRRPEVYEVAIAAAFCFATAALLLFAAALLRPEPSRLRLAAGSLCAGLAFGARPPLGIVVLFGLGAWVWMVRRGSVGGRGERVSAAAAALGPFALCVLAYAVYNTVRFGSPADFGIAYQLLAVAPESQLRLSYLPTGLWYYAIAPPLARVAFPFFSLPPPPAPPFRLPAGYQVEPTGGVLPTLPLVAFLALAPVALRSAGIELRNAVASTAAVGAALLLFDAAFLSGATMRYGADFRTLLLVPAILVWCALALRARPGWRRRTVAGVGCALAAWGILVSVMVSFAGEKGRLEALRPDTYASLARTFEPVSTLIAQISGHPLLVAVGDDDVGARGYDHLSLDGAAFDVGSAATTVRVVAPSTGIFRLRATVRRAAGLPRGGKVLLAVSANGTGAYGAVRGGVDTFSLRLRQGFNDLRLQAPVDLGGYEPAPGVPVARLEGVRVR
jgi:hypothetical protein